MGERHEELYKPDSLQEALAKAGQLLNVVELKVRGDSDFLHEFDEYGFLKVEILEKANEIAAKYGILFQEIDGPRIIYADITLTDGELYRGIGGGLVTALEDLCNQINANLYEEQIEEDDEEE